MGTETYTGTISRALHPGLSVAVAVTLLALCLSCNRGREAAPAPAPWVEGTGAKAGNDSASGADVEQIPVPGLPPAAEAEVKTEEPEPAPLCVADCRWHTCGSDGCGGSCGTCPEGSLCIQGRCAAEGCQPMCDGLNCGWDGCGGSCGECLPGYVCDDGRCDRRIPVSFETGTVPVPGQVLPRALVNLTVGTRGDRSCKLPPFPLEKARAALAASPGAALLVTLEPTCGLAPFLAAAGGEELNSLRRLVSDAGRLPGPVFFRFAPDMNKPGTPWGPCGPDEAPCLKSPSYFKDAYRLVSAVVRENRTGDLKTIWCPSLSPEGNYQEYFPDVQYVDVLGLTVMVPGDQAPGPGTLDRYLAEFRALVPSAEQLPLYLFTGVDCPMPSTLECVDVRMVFGRDQDVWGPWGQLESFRSKGHRSEECLPVTGDGMFMGLRPKGEEQPGICRDYYVGGISYPLDMEQGVDFSMGDSLVFYARRLGDGDAPTLHLEVCDASTPGCPKDNPCCPEQTFSRILSITETAWTMHRIPFSEFLPTKEGGAKGTMDWSHVRSVTLHLICDGEEVPVADLNVDGLALGRNEPVAGVSCQDVAGRWARQVFTPERCGKKSDPDGVIWLQDVRPREGGFVDHRLLDRKVFVDIFTSTCFSPSFL